MRNVQPYDTDTRAPNVKLVVMLTILLSVKDWSARFTSINHSSKSNKLKLFECINSQFTIIIFLTYDRPVSVHYIYGERAIVGIYLKWHSSKTK